MIDCKSLAQSIKDSCRKDLARISTSYYLKIIQVEGDKASDAYTRGKRKDCEEIGLGCKHVLLPENCDRTDVVNAIQEGNADPRCCGIILQLPLPEHLDKYKKVFIDLIKPDKDVDGFRKDSPFSPCTPSGIIEILKDAVGDLTGLHCVVIGRSELVGYPTFEMLNKLNATVSLCNSHTPRRLLQALCLEADVVISATGVPKLIDKFFVYPNTTVIDAGISRDWNGHLCGDCDKAMYDYVENITPVPGGVGLMTRAMLMKNCVRSVKEREGVMDD